jgi:hypothetical protein
MTNKILIENNMLLFHSATLIDKDKNSYILYGPSCIGKSTISNNSSLQVISDDLLIIKPMKDNCYEFFKTPFTRDKSNTINKLENVKIAGLYRLKQSTNEHFEKMNQSVSFAELIGNIPDLHSQIHNEKLLQLVKNLSSKIPNHYLYFTKSSIFEQIIN